MKTKFITLDKQEQGGSMYVYVVEDNTGTQGVWSKRETAERHVDTINFVNETRKATYKRLIFDSRLLLKGIKESEELMKQQDEKLASTISVDYDYSGRPNRSLENAYDEKYDDDDILF